VANAPDDRGQHHDCSDAGSCLVLAFYGSKHDLLRSPHVHFQHRAGSGSRHVRGRGRASTLDKYLVWTGLRRRGVHWCDTPDRSSPRCACPDDGQVATGRLQRARENPVRRGRETGGYGQRPCSSIAAGRAAPRAIPCRSWTRAADTHHQSSWLHRGPRGWRFPGRREILFTHVG